MDMLLVKIITEFSSSILQMLSNTRRFFPLSKGARGMSNHASCLNIPPPPLQRGMSNHFSSENSSKIFKYGKFWTFTILVLFLTACEENKPIIPPLGEVEIQAAERKVLVEEFTGVRCVNCPQGSEEVENLLAIYGDNLIAVGIHAGSFSRPYNDSNMDFRTEAGDQIINFLGVPLGYPSAVINRTDEDGNGRLQTGQSTWAGLIQQELNKATNINLTIGNSFQTTNNQLITNISITPTEDINDDLRLSVMLVETDIVDRQLTPDGEKDDYIHRHNLRHMLTNATGDAITESLTKGNTIEENFTFTIPDDWKTEDVSVVAFVHRSGDTKEVLQVEELKILE